MPYIGVDFDGTMAHHEGIVPLAPMIERIKRVRAEGAEVRIITARAQVQGRDDDRSAQQTVGPVFDHAQVALVRAWCLEHLGEELTVQYWKDYDMIELWDDRAFHSARALYRATQAALRPPSALPVPAFTVCDGWRGGQDR